MDKSQNKNFIVIDNGVSIPITPSRIYHALFMKAKQNLIPEDNQLASFSLNVAETQLMAPIVKENYRIM